MAPLRPTRKPKVLEALVLETGERSNKQKPNYLVHIPLRPFGDSWWLSLVQQ